MKKKYIMLILSICMVIAISSTVISFAETTTESSIPVTQDVSEIKAEKINLSLDGAYMQLENSKTMELIKLKKQSDQGVAKGYSETVSNYNKMEESDALIVGYDSSNKKIAKARRTFAKLMIEPNNEARLNVMKQEALQRYYTLKNTETQVEINKESLELKKKFLETTKRKYAVGAVSKKEVENAEKDLNNAETQLVQMENALEQMKLNFNSYLGYDTSKELVLIDNIQEVELSEITLLDAITSALKNRNEIKEAAYNVEIAQLNFNSYKAYPKSSSKYISAKTQLLNAEIANENIPIDIELDVRTKYDSMMDAYNSVQVGKKNLQIKEDSLNTITTKYSLGMVTVSDVQKAQLDLDNAKLNQANALLNYTLAVESYNLSTGVGTKAVRV